MSKSETNNQAAWNKNFQVKINNVADVRTLVENLRAGDINSLSQAITLAESVQPEHGPLRMELMDACLPFTGNAKRIGITGIPGAGKSTFIEALGLLLCNAGKKVAVLAIDPSSTRSGGSILGDKTRMAELSVHPNAFIRPSPGGNSIGGIAANTREALLLCEAADFDVVLIETIGVGQSETWVRSITDLFLLLTVPNTGDELQGIKRGIMEMADLIVVNKADGDMITKAKQTRQFLLNAIHLFPFPDSKIPVDVVEVSSLEKKGIDATWTAIEKYDEAIHTNGWKKTLRKAQEKEWFYRLLNEEWAKMIHSVISEKDWIELEKRIESGHSGIYREVNDIITRLTNQFGRKKA
ncbi:MAG: methylmalonyl Co-A mutase-associated GTPase MeaB [Flavobacteriales bacterium]